MTTNTRFVHVPSAEMLAAVKRWGVWVSSKGGRFGELAAGHEVAFVMAPPGSKAEIQVYTSVARGEAEARACGEDAVRVVVGTRTKAGEWRNVREPQKLLRTAPQGPEDARVRAFLGRLHQAVVAAYKLAGALPCCPQCGAMMARRDGSRGAFLGCVEYPACRGSREIKATNGGSRPGVGTGACRGPGETAESTASRGRTRISDQHEPVTPGLGNRAKRQPAESQDQPRSASSIRRVSARDEARDLAAHLDHIAEKHHGLGALDELASIDPRTFK